MSLENKFWYTKKPKIPKACWLQHGKILILSRYQEPFSLKQIRTLKPLTTKETKFRKHLVVKRKTQKWRKGTFLKLKRRIGQYILEKESISFQNASFKRFEDERKEATYIDFSGDQLKLEHFNPNYKELYVKFLAIEASRKDSDQTEDNPIFILNKIEKVLSMGK